jgi:hypothetical protein
MLPVASVAGRLIEAIPFADKLMFGCVFAAAEGARFKYEAAEFKQEHATVAVRKQPARFRVVAPIPAQY